MLMSPVGLRSEKGCAGDAQQKLKSTDLTSCQHQQTETVKKYNQRENGKNWSQVPGGCLIPRRIGRHTGCNVTLTLTYTVK
jgi:hypothetical protein